MSAIRQAASLAIVTATLFATAAQAHPTHLQMPQSRHPGKSSCTSAKGWSRAFPVPISCAMAVRAARLAR
jgi:hypothetical protein